MKLTAKVNLKPTQLLKVPSLLPHKLFWNFLKDMTSIRFLLIDVIPTFPSLKTRSLIIGGLQRKSNHPLIGWPISKYISMKGRLEDTALHTTRTESYTLTHEYNL